MLPVAKKAYEAVIAQGEASVDTNNKCRYRGPNGLKCAAGHAIPDEVYDPWMEGLGVDEVIKQFDLDFSPKERDELYKLQAAHDSASYNKDNFVELFKLRVRGLFTDATNN